MLNLRNTFIVGAAKSGTTALYYLLSQHPGICTPVVKEPNYFSNIENSSDPVHPGNGPGDNGTVWTEDQESYHNLYRPGKDHTMKLDASVSYLYSTTAAAQIANYDPESNIIIVLRNPIERAFSHYKHLLRDGRETVSFTEALDLEESRIQKGWEFSWHLTSMGLYSDQIQRYLNHFEQEQVRIYLLEDIKSDISRVVNEITEFVGLEAYKYDFQQQEQNESGVARSWLLSRMVNWILGYKEQINKVVPPRISHKALQLFRTLNIRKSDLEIADDTRMRLLALFDEDIRETGELIGRNLDAWRNELIHNDA
ncbi:sulfotransferase [Aliifodinibius sp. S!AR15-10]|uniref:sulfotransferase family protein n=1 Tax=Aliifodinibius sp. S!AR15-10 TaxID=2950437 RepID=UPI00285DA53C|nr:sulfotransferase domain-containing protein [Aliifodinibius sp. S!AR15-10]MDR8392618.1 sulfotransferase [Aliifodinibius sp. S!AR15-10]